jgi:hypothetical protein
MKTIQIIGMIAGSIDIGKQKHNRSEVEARSIERT